MRTHNYFRNGDKKVAPFGRRKLQEQIKETWTSRQIVQNTVPLGVNTMMKLGTYTHSRQGGKTGATTAHATAIDMMPVLGHTTIGREIGICGSSLFSYDGSLFGCELL